MMIIESSIMKKKYTEAMLAAPYVATPVLLTGETGVGKDVLAKKIHKKSEVTGKFRLINSAQLSNVDLAKSEFFGHEKGAFTGAYTKRIGALEAFSDGTVFLNEVADMHPEVQGLLLDFFDHAKFYREGGNEEISSDARVICATNKNLEEAVEARAFREDLLYRLTVVRIRIPPLRERPEDILPLVNHFINILNTKYNKKKCISEDAMAVLRSAYFPGNVRQLENIVEQLFIFSKNDRINETDLTDDTREAIRVGYHNRDPVRGQSYAGAARPAGQADQPDGNNEDVSPQFSTLVKQLRAFCENNPEEWPRIRDVINDIGSSDSSQSANMSNEEYIKILRTVLKSLGLDLDAALKKDQVKGKGTEAAITLARLALGEIKLTTCRAPNESRPEGVASVGAITYFITEKLDSNQTPHPFIESLQKAYNTIEQA